MKLVAIVIQNIATCFASPQSEFIKKVALGVSNFLSVLEIWCSIMKPKKEPHNYRLECAIES